MTGPFWMEIAQGDLGVHENSPDAQGIAERAAKAMGLGSAPDLRNDKYHWCSLFIAACLGAEKFDLTGITPMAKSWRKLKNATVVYDADKSFGDIAAARYGDICVYHRGATTAPTGHVNFFVSQDDKHIYGLGGNQGDRVNIAPFSKAKTRLWAILRPVPVDGIVERPAPIKTDDPDEFEQWVSELITLEGGIVNDPDDPGGLTNMGVTFARFVEWRVMQGLPRPTAADLRALDREEAKRFYRVLYWDAARVPSLESRALRFLHADCAVNQGVGTAIRLLQMSLGFTGKDIDGQFGPMTAKAEDKADQPKLVIEYAARRMNRYGNTKNWNRYGLGWSRRLMRVALPAYATLGTAAEDVRPTDMPQPEGERTPAAWLDDPEFREIAARGTVTMLGFLFKLIERHLKFANGWKTWAGIGLFFLNAVAALYGVTPSLPEGEAGSFIQRIIEIMLGDFGPGHALMAWSSAGLAQIGLLHKGYKQAKREHD